MLEPDVTPLFRALGDQTRRQIFEFLCERCQPLALEESGQVHPVKGATVGDVCCHVTGSDKFSSTISFHLKELRIAGLISVQKSGKYMICSVRHEALEALSAYVARLSRPDLSLCGPEDPEGCGT